MALLVADCPRCRANEITFTVSTAQKVQPWSGVDWQSTFEAFCICRRCFRSTVFVLQLNNYDARETFIKAEAWRGDIPLNSFFDLKGFISTKDLVAISPPEHLPFDVDTVFREGAACFAINCHNAASTMFRLCLDLSTKGLLPPEETPDGPNRRQQRELAARLDWLFATGRLPDSLRELASCVREDGNDGRAGTLKKEDAEDLIDFTVALLTRIYTEPERVRLAQARRVARRADR
jgi:hypothetical protein